jgi:hypothetical protein
VAESNSAADQIARDDVHLESLGIKPQLNRTLGFMANSMSATDTCPAGRCGAR